LRALAAGTWRLFLDAIPARATCAADVTLAGAWHLANRALYDPDRRLVTVRIPATAADLRGSLVHEFAHHFEFTCPTQRLLRPAFLAAQGLLRRTPWRGGSTWARIPSEQFAEAMVQFVLGRPSLPLVVVRPGALEVLRRWARGG